MTRAIFILLLFGLLAAIPAGAQNPTAEGWQQIAAGARKEGRVVVVGSPDPVMRNGIIPKFTARFGIPVEFIAGRSSEIVARLRNERAAGIYSVDVFLSGPDTTANTLYGEKFIDPLKPLLVVTEVTDGRKWKKGKVWFADPEEKYVARPFSSAASLFFINAEFVNRQELKSIRDLLDPRWKGKISAEDPTTTGAGANLAASFYFHLGEDFVRKLYIDQKVVRTRDRRQMSDWLARGTQPICLNCREDDVRSLQRDGFKLVEVFEIGDFPGVINGSPWMLTVAGRAPDPRAAQLFANWILSKEGLEIYARGYGSATLRTDVDEAYLNPRIIPKPGGGYFDDTDWKWIVSGRKENREKVWHLLKKR